MKPFEYELKRAYSFELKGKQLALYSYCMYVATWGRGKGKQAFFLEFTYKTQILNGPHPPLLL